ncbi:exocyst complex component EXO70B1-like [Impatiens glandulifera]|uniref:exocyst complex component EXO70B1-like n=1 Tax=Impatiens glandulifera TaxID=253017 RepID=UPI001FB0EF1D|nr:exocyst complex component EXO70B1-like [Impatiens glandulifera]
MADNGDEKLVAVARQIAKSLGNNGDTMTDDILQIFSKFDDRLREKLVENLNDDRNNPRTWEHTLKSLERQISRYVSADHPIWSDSADAASFLDYVDELLAVVRDLNPMAGDKSVSSYLHRAEDLLHQSMFRLEDEFRSLMDRGSDSFDLLHRNGESNYSSDDEVDDGQDYQIPVARPLVDYDIFIDALPTAIINDLHEIAARMVTAGYRKECSHAYSTCRREFLEESFSRLGFQRLSVEEVQKMPWSELEDEIERWIKASNVALRILYPSERRLCDRVFFGFSSASDLAFMEVCRGSATQLLNFAEAIAGSRSPERLFKVLDVYETIRDLLPEFEVIFSDQYCLFLRNEAISIWKRLGESIRGIFMELENLVRCDPPKAPISGGGFHPITRYVMNYLRAACRSRETLEQVFEEIMLSSTEQSLLHPSYMLSDQMTCIMELLESNLEAKSKIYGDPALCSIFMVNNGNYIVQKARDSELGALLGNDWIRKQQAKIRQYLGNYQRSSWSKIIGLLKSGGSPSRTMREKLKSFNNYFEEICRSQSGWVMYDEQLRRDLISSIASHLSSAYRSFLGRLQGIPEMGKHIKYGVEDVEAQIEKLFQGGSSSGSSGKKRETK